MDQITVIQSVLDTVQVFAQVAAAEAFEVGSGYKPRKLRWLIIIVISAMTVIWSAWVAWGRFEAYYAKRIEFKGLLLDVVGVVIVVVVMMGILSLGAGS